MIAFSKEESAARIARCRSLLARLAPEAGGLLIFSRVSMYYFTGTLAAGILWIPLEGEPLLLIRKSLERAKLESPHTAAESFRSYRSLAETAAERGVPLSPVIAAEQAHLPWGMAEMLQKRLPQTRFISGDAVLARCRAVKTPYEIAVMRRTGEAHRKALCEAVPGSISPGMTEAAIARETLVCFLRHGHSNLIRMSAFGEEMNLGHISAGDSGNYPSHYNGALGVEGLCPAVPFMGSETKVWREGEILSIDAGFNTEGYSSDKTALFFAGNERDIPAPVRVAHEFCMRLEEETAAMLRPGAVPSQIYAHALKRAEEAGFKEGFMGLGGNQVPFLGHGIGLYVDEFPVLAHRFDEPLEAGMTVAVEPKIGLPGFGMAGGENTFLITENGGESLSGPVQPIICVEQ